MLGSVECVMRKADVEASARSLRALLGEVDAGRIDATPREVAHLRGVVDALALVVRTRSRP
jgi:hypothetical protein